MTPEDLGKLVERYDTLFDDPEALLAEMRRQGQKTHVLDDQELSFFLGSLVGRYTRLLQEKKAVQLSAVDKLH